MRKLLIFCYAFLLAGCPAPLVTEPLDQMYPYAPRNNLTLNSAILVDRLDDQRPGHPPINGIDIGAMDNSRAVLSQPVGDFVGDAVRREFRQAGIAMNTQKCILGGSVLNMRVTWSLFQSTYETTIRYVLTAGATTAFDQTYSAKTTSDESHTDQPVFARYMHAALANNIAQLLNNRDFLIAAQTTCAP